MNKDNIQWVKLCYLSLFFTLSMAADRITTSSSLSGKQTVVSSGGIFELGFFSPSGNSSSGSKYYIGIWYKKVSLQTVVWVANRESPVLDTFTSELKFLNGNLVLLTNGSKSPIWSTKLEKPTSLSSFQAVLTDHGNLIVREPGPNESSNRILWQSFDHPGDTWLPGSKIAFNKKTNKSQFLTSWKNIDDPAPGLFFFKLEPDNKEYIIMWNGTRKYWTSGPWDQNQQIFSLVPEMRLNYIYNFSFVDNENESYFTYSVYDNKIISRFVMHVSGQIKQFTWLENTQQWNLFWSQPRQQCQVYAYCGKFGSCYQNSLPFCNCLSGFKPQSQSDWGLNDYSGGCVRKTRLQCGSSGSIKGADRFWVNPNMGFDPKGDPNAHSIMVTNSNDCELACLNNCSCIAYSYDGGVCSIWTGDLLNLQKLSDGDNSGKTLFIRLNPSEFPSTSNKKLIIGIVVGLVGGILALFGLVFVIRWRRKNRLIRSTKGVGGSLIPFGYRQLQNATKNFSEKLGGGGFGSVFKGTLPDSSVIAVKKLESLGQGEKQFRSEVSTIGTIQHYNLVRLRGFCSDGAKKLLVYDYMPNGSLDSHLFHDNGSKFLDWKTRYQIALGTARGLAYLHEKCRDCIIHCDIKPENILLDADFFPKVADFGLAKLVGRDFSRVLTTMRGTRGYLAPEWISGVAITAKADVFSYGMMLFEIISGRRNTEQSVDGKVSFFPTWAASKIGEGEDIMTILDPKLERNADVEEILKMCKLACWCIQDDEYNRPSMGQVVQILEGVLDVNLPPMPRSLQVFVDNGNEDDIMFFTESSTSQSSQTRENSSAGFSKTKSSSPSVST